MFAKSRSAILIGTTTLALMSSVNAQTDLGTLASSALVNLVSSGCRTALQDTLSPDSELGQCQHYQALAGITDETTLISYLDTNCGSSPCTNEVLAKGAQTIWEGCQTEFGYIGLTEDFIKNAFGTYPVSREISCLKHDADYCLAELYEGLTELEQVLHNSSSSLEVSKYYLCTPCAVAGMDLVLVQYPMMASIDLGEGKTVVDYANEYCADKGVSVSTDGTLPQGISQTAANSTFPAEGKLYKKSVEMDVAALKARFLRML